MEMDAIQVALGIVKVRAVVVAILDVKMDVIHNVKIHVKGQHADLVVVLGVLELAVVLLADQGVLLVVVLVVVAVVTVQLPVLHLVAVLDALEVVMDHAVDPVVAQDVLECVKLVVLEVVMVLL